MKKNTGPIHTVLFFFLLPLLIQGILASCASRGAAQAEEYFSIGMAYYEMGKFAEAEKWLNRARAVNKTMTASDYNLGRIAFETGRYEEAAKYFERILSKDPDNVMALKAAAYSRIKNGDLKKAETHYNRVLALVPESADDGFNYALVLYGLNKYEECEEVLNRYAYALEENSASLLLLARAQRAQDKIEAIDSYGKWAIVNAETASSQGLYEYAQVLEDAGQYARALEQYKEALNALTTDTGELTKAKLHFEQARILMTVDPENSEGLTELNAAETEGFDDTDALEVLLKDERITEANKDEIKRIIDAIFKAATPEEQETVETEETEESEEPKTSDLE